MHDPHIIRTNAERVRLVRDQETLFERQLDRSESTGDVAEGNLAATAKAKTAPLLPSQAHAELGGGLRWDVVEIVARAPKRLVPHVLTMIVTLRHAPGMTMGLQALAKAMKTTPTIAASCIEHAPQVLETVRKGAAIALRTAPALPWELDKAALEEIDKKALADTRRREQEAARAASDALDTPFNRMRQALEDLGLATPQARKFAGYLTRTYGFEAATRAVAIAADAKPGEPMPYIISVLRKSVTVGDDPGTRGSFARTVRALQRPDGTGRTSFVGWEDHLQDGVRHKLYRLPNGQLRREAPNPDDTPPTFAQDPGWKVAS